MVGWVLFIWSKNTYICYKLTAVKKKKYTIEDYNLLEEGAPFQLVNFDLIRSPLPIPEHQIISGRIFNKMSLFLDQTSNNGIVMYAPVDVHLDEGNIFQQDLLFISGSRTEIIH
jgi:Uma2 family endonuclease